MEEKELWMNKLKEKLADYSEPAPASGWEPTGERTYASCGEENISLSKMDDGCCSYYNISCRFVSKSVFSRDTAADEIRHIQTPALASTPDALPGVQQPDMPGNCCGTCLTAGNSRRSFG